MDTPYRIPSKPVRIEVEVVRSRFITSVAQASTVDEAKQFIMSIRNEISDASHHVYAYKIGYHNSVIEGMSDDGEPSGTSGPPTLAVIRGSEIGDIVMVTTRYFGGTKLGTGGLVRAYTLAAQTAIENLDTELKVKKVILGIDMAYHYFEQVKRLLTLFDAIVTDETFGSEVSIIAVVIASHVPDIIHQLEELTSGQAEAVILSD